MTKSEMMLMVESKSSPTRIVDDVKYLIEVLILVTSAIVSQRRSSKLPSQSTLLAP